MTSGIPTEQVADLRLRLAAFARDCVTHGDMTPMGERMLLRLLDELVPVVERGEQ